jgi:hypothetical protein
MDTYGNLYNTTYKVIRSYPVQGKTTVLAVDILEEGQDDRQDYFVMHYLNNRLVIDDIYNYGGNESLLERESKIDEMLLYAKNSLLADNRYDSLIPLSIAYFNEDEYTRLQQLPRITENQLEEFKASFALKLEPSDEKDYSAYELFILNADGHYEAADPQLVMLREMMIEKGFNPFSSIPYFISREAEHVDGPNQGGGWLMALVFLFGMLLNVPGVNYVLMVLAITGVIWAIYRFIKSPIDRKKNNPEDLAKSQKSFLRKLMNIIAIVGLMIAGGYLGFWTGWNLSDNKNGGTIITITIALFSIPIGAVLGFVFGFLILIKKKKTDNNNNE